MSKELDALKKYKSIKDYYFHKATANRFATLRIFSEEEAIYQIIETALKEYELMKEIRITARFDLAQVNKEHKALEILKEKVDELEFLRNCVRSGFDVKQYNETISSMHGDFLTQEEYDLLKEILK